MPQNATVVQFPTGMPSESAAPVTTPQTAFTMTPDVMVDKYLKLRNKVAEIKDAHKKQLAPYDAVMERLEAMLLNELNKAGVDSMRASTGTFYKVLHTSVKVNEWSKTLAFIQEHEFWELLEARVNKTAALDVLKSTDEPIPGVVVSTYTEVNVRRPTAKE